MKLKHRRKSEIENENQQQIINLSEASISKASEENKRARV